MVKINTVTTQLPEFMRDTAQIIDLVKNWMRDQDERYKRKVVKIMEGAGVDKRGSIMDPIEVFINPSFGSRNDIYAREIKKMGKQCLEKALNKAGWKPTDLDYIITVSCTGIMIPSVDAYLINELKMRQDVMRLPVTEMGCAAGVSGIIYAHNFLKANPGKRAALVAIEAPSATFQIDDFSMANIVSTAIFGDGAACVLLSSREEDEGPEIIDEEMFHFYDATGMMGFKLVDTGLQMILDKEVPDKIAEHFPAIIHPFLEKNNLTIEDVDHLIFHPGGRKIVETVEELFGSLGKDITDTKEVLRLYGNMSSATVLFVLERFMDKKPKNGSYGLMLSFGPGFSAQRVLLKF
ncbi:putative naringenin-chalcone synthase [Aequorivita sublithincola DSM 14238]|uniref:Putative naringenin-chalcone synthase n=1 Tax=Aequorivita sublithincola (strain DSM 14238 / LMG 21431 / ACAM 643 / 9-3) TaxID=746697 RepID=I3YYU5_AEQSU|nr:type III polyketide synthase [Aequorivita sublithincola]AFL82163.1 putative naringenin-chalcone synthase [Aequorivita sublithincola DSM 14238]